jgi:hypothetical protein
MPEPRRSVTETTLIRSTGRFDPFSTDLARATRKQIFHTLSERVGGSSTIGAAWSFPSLRTDSVNRGFCISLLTLAIVVLTKFFRFCFFFIIPRS